MARSTKHNDKEHGAILVMFTLGLTVLFVATGMAIDLGLAYSSASSLSKAMDAAALTGARMSNAGDYNVREAVRQVAEANLSRFQSDHTSVDIQLTHTADDTFDVRVTGSTSAPTFFGRLLGKTKIDVSKSAGATRFPMDISLVLDLSGSLSSTGSFDDLQDAVADFVEYFDDDLDQVGTLGYSTWTQELVSIRKNFKSVTQSAVYAASTISDTNIESGLHHAKLMLDRAPQRELSNQVVVLFTDGYPTAFTDDFNMDNEGGPPCGGNHWNDYGDEDSDPDTEAGDPTGYRHPASQVGVCLGCSKDQDGDGKPKCYHAHLAGYVNGGFRGMFQEDNGLKVDYFKSNGHVKLRPNKSGYSSPKPIKLPDGSSVTGSNIRRVAKEQAEGWADVIRDAGYTIYTIGLGSPTAPWYFQPDLDLMRRLANEDGVSSWTQPQGMFFFAPSAAELEEAFTDLAQHLTIRLVE